MTDLTQIRREYVQGGLTREDLTPAPMQLFEQWMTQAVNAGLADPTAMTLATVNEQGQPRQRIVLLKKFDQQGFVFFTNLESQKANDIAIHPQVSLHFPWHMLERQVSVMGTANKLSAKEVFDYFITRPKESQIAAWASPQSKPLSARKALEIKFAEMKVKFAQGEIPVPKFWGGYRVVPHTIEFWQGGEHRLHDRFRYQSDQQHEWIIERLAP